MSRFEDRLWSELVEQHGAALAEPPVRLVPARRRPRLLPALAGAVALAAAVAVLVIGLGHGGGSSAYAVVSNPDGTVTLTLNELIGAEPANRRLEQLGVPARIAPVRANCPTKESEVQSAGLPPEAGRQVYELVGGAGHTSMRIDPAAIPDGDTLLLRANERRPGFVALGAVVIKGKVPTCLPPGPGE